MSPVRRLSCAVTLLAALTLVAAPGLARSHPYLQPDGQGWADNDARFLAFSQAVAAVCRQRPPDVLHLNDWHTAATLAALDPAPPSVLSIHNLAYQGQTDSLWLERLGARARSDPGQPTSVGDGHGRRPGGVRER